MPQVLTTRQSKARISTRRKSLLPSRAGPLLCHLQEPLAASRAASNPQSAATPRAPPPAPSTKPAFPFPSQPGGGSGKFPLLLLVRLSQVAPSLLEPKSRAPASHRGGEGASQVGSSPNTSTDGRTCGRGVRAACRPEQRLRCEVSKPRRLRSGPGGWKWPGPDGRQAPSFYSRRRRCL